MEQNNIEAEIIEGVKLGRSKVGSYNIPEQINRLKKITYILSNIDKKSPFYDEIQFVIYLANQQVKNIDRLENNIDKITFLYLREYTNAVKPSERMPYDRLDSMRFK